MNLCGETEDNNAFYLVFLNDKLIEKKNKTCVYGLNQIQASVMGATEEELRECGPQKVILEPMVRLRTSIFEFEVVHI